MFFDSFKFVFYHFDCHIYIYIFRGTFSDAHVHHDFQPFTKTAECFGFLAYFHCFSFEFRRRREGCIFVWYNFFTFHRLKLCLAKFFLS
eukprot:UN13210